MAGVRWRAMGLLTAAVLAAHGPSLRGTFHFDDHHSLVENPHVRSLASVPGFFTDASRFSRNPGSDMYRPVVLTSYAVNHALGGLNPRGYLAVNLVVHLAATLAVFVSLQRLGLGSVALGVAALFAVHPLTAQPVNYISSRSESLAALFAWLSVLLYLGHGRWPRAGSVFCYAAALGSKAVAVWIAPALALHAWVKGDRVWQRQWGYWAVTIAYLALVQEQLGEAFVRSPVRGVSEQLWTQVKALVYYMRLAVVPHPLTIDHDFAPATSAVSPVVLAALLVAASLVVWAWRSRGTRSMQVVLVCWALLALAPTTITPLNVLVSEHRVYASLPPAFALAVLCAQRVPIQRVLLGLLLVLLAAISWQRSAAWSSEMVLWEDAAAKSRYAARPHIQLGLLHRKAGDLTAAAAHLNTALNLESDNAPAHNNLGNVFMSQGRLPDAEASYARALELLPSYPEALTNLGVLRGRQGRWEEALALHESALTVSPDRPEVLTNAAVALLELGEYGRSEALLRRVLAQGAATASTLYNLGGALGGLGQEEAAVSAYDEALAMDPEYPKPYLRLAQIHEAAGRDLQAREAYEDFLRHWRGDPQVAAAVRQRIQAERGGAR